MSILSEREIIAELGNGIFFHPLKPGSIRNCSLYLTASEYAYSIGKQDILPLQTDNQQKKYFELPARDTTLVWTDESIWFNSYFCSPVYSRVTLVAQGVGHIGTRVTPCWSGILCIALHNVSDNEIRINIQDVEEPIAYLMVHRLKSKSDTKTSPEVSARVDVLEKLQNPNKINAWLNKKSNQWMTNNKDLLKELMIKSPEYQRIKTSFLKAFFLKFIAPDPMTLWTAITGLAGLAALIITLIRK